MYSLNEFSMNYTLIQQRVPRVAPRFSTTLPPAGFACPVNTDILKKQSRSSLAAALVGRHVSHIFHSSMVSKVAPMVTAIARWIFTLYLRAWSCIARNVDGRSMLEISLRYTAPPGSRSGDEGRSLASRAEC